MINSKSSKGSLDQYRLSKRTENSQIFSVKP